MTYDPDAQQHLFPLATRLEVVDADGRSFVRCYEDAGMTIEVQDKGRTVKVFAGQPKENPS